MFKRHPRYVIEPLSRREEIWLCVGLSILSAVGITFVALVRSGVL
jgi:hypothetical protein